MNILHTETLKHWGGQQNKVLKELAATRALGHNVFLMCNPDTAIARRAGEMGIRVFEHPISKKNYHRTIPFTLNLLQTHAIDILVTHGSTDSWMGGIAARLSSRKVIAMRERHNMYSIDGFVSKFLHRSLFHYIIAVSETVRDYLVDDIKVAPRRVLLLPSVVDVKAFDAAPTTLRQELRIPAEALVVGIFSLLRREKGLYDFAELVKALQPRHPGVYFVFGGKCEDQTRDAINLDLSNNGIDSAFVRWTGYREDAANVMKSYDIFVFPSHTEGLGTVLLEAMACRLPLVAYDRRPMSDIVAHGVNGYVAPFKDIAAMGHRIGELLIDGQKRRAFGEASYAGVTKTYDEASLGRHIQALLESLPHD